MKRLLPLLLLITPLSSFATPDTNQMDMTQMQNMVMELQKCMQQIDQQEMKKIREQAQALEKDLKALCDSGKRDAAQDKAMTFAMQMQKSPAMSKLKDCGKDIQAMMPTLQDLSRYEKVPDKNDNVCDHLK
jgi:hypothetical protein